MENGPRRSIVGNPDQEAVTMDDANTKEFFIELDEFVDEIEHDVKAIMHKTAEYAFEQVVKLSPVWAGDYVKSHRIGINSIDPSFTATDFSPDQSFGMYPDKVSPPVAAAFRAAALNRTNEIMVEKLGDTIYISNSAGHAEDVEFGSPDGKTPERHVYHQATQKTKVYLENLYSKHENGNKNDLGIPF